MLNNSLQRDFCLGFAALWELKSPCGGIYMLNVVSSTNHEVIIKLKMYLNKSKEQVI